MGRPRKNLDGLNQVGGKAPDVKPEVRGNNVNKTQPISNMNVAQGNIAGPDAVAKILGIYKRDHYESYNNIDEYRTAIKVMSLTQLQKHSIEVANIVPMYDRNRLIQKLEYAFGEAKAKKMYKSPAVTHLTAEQQNNITQLLSRRK